MAKLIYLSPSNHGVGANKCKKSGCYEDKHTRPIAEACAKHLKNNGFDVIVAKASQSMAERCSESNSKKAALHVPIHTNAFSDESARYLMFMFYRDNDTYREIFNDVAPSVEAVYPGKLKAKFAKRTDLYEINVPTAKSMYCEMGFHTNQKDCDEFIHKPEMVGKALAKGICKYFGVSFKEDGSSGSGSTGSGSSGSGSTGSSGTAPSGQVDSGTSGKKYVPGMAVKLSAVPLYAASTSKVPSTHVTGTYYLWDDEVVRGRLRITNLKSRVGISGQVTGWIDKDRI